MKKTALFILALATAATVTSCAKIDVQGDIEPKEPEQQNENIGGSMGGMQVVSPIKLYNSPEEIAAALGFTVYALPEAENVSYSTISNNLAQVKFSIDGIKYTLRADDEAGDFSGVYIAAESEKTEEVSLPNGTSVSVLTKTLTDGSMLISWSNYGNTVHFSLYVEGQPENIGEIILSAAESNNIIIRY